jgi:FkbM family methyltransferase
MTTFSQNDEENYILDYFSGLTNGKLIEIGAYDPFKFSNTRALIEQGWSGVLVEPDPICYARLNAEYSETERITLIQKAITEADGEITFYSSGGDAIGSTSIAHKQKWEQGYKVKFTETTVPTLAMYNLLEQYGEGCDFINIDVEGCNLDLFHLIPIDFIQKVKMICIEHDGHLDHMKSVLATEGFRFIMSNAENLIMAR